ncbi:uncharacterized protein LOC130973675 [Arachis stenosperma]|uniref:uncharacterized protein LOC130973675 n=1 Tax=Arachis stenosperma TaxID=217475 RepID=UPI0025ACF588|nr:uncharacterized protein LOC130973675 [Arachis stenosperma]
MFFTPLRVSLPLELGLSHLSHRDVAVAICVVIVLHIVGRFVALFVAGGRSSRSWGSSSSCFESRRQPPSCNQKLLHDLGKGDGEELKSTAIHCLCRLRGQAVDESAHRQVDEILAELMWVKKKRLFLEKYSEKMLESPYHWCRIGLVSTDHRATKCASVCWINPSECRILHCI